MPLAQRETLPGPATYVMTRTTLVLSLLLCSCVTIGRHQELEEQVLRLEKFKQEIRSEQERDERRFQNLAEQIRASADKLQKQMAAISAKIDAQSDDMRKLVGRMEELEHLAGRLSAEAEIVKKFLDNRFGLTVTALPADLPSDVGKLYDYGVKRIEAKQYDLARAVLRHFLTHHPEDERADKVTMLIGRSYHEQRRWQHALQEYGKIYEKHADKSPSEMPEVVPQALLLAGEALEQGGNCNKAKEMYRLLIRTLRKTPEAAKAKARLKKGCP